MHSIKTVVIIILLKCVSSKMVRITVGGGVPKTDAALPL